MRKSILIFYWFAYVKYKYGLLKAELEEIAKVDNRTFSNKY